MRILYALNEWLNAHSDYRCLLEWSVVELSVLHFISINKVNYKFSWKIRNPYK